LDPEVADVLKALEAKYDGRVKALEADNKKLTASNDNLQNIYADGLVKKVKGEIEGEIVTGLRCVEAHAFGSTGVTNKFRELEGRIAPAVAAGDVKVENVNLDDILIAFVKGGRA